MVNKKGFKIVWILFLLFSCEEKSSEILKFNETIQEVAKLTTVEHIYNDIIFIKKQKRFLGIPISKKEVLFSVEIKVTAGYFLDANLEVTKEGKKITVKMPKPVILMVDADETSLNEYYSKYFGGRVSLLFYYDEIEKQKRKVVAESIERGILKEAEIRLKQFLNQVYLKQGFESVELVYPEERQV